MEKLFNNGRGQTITVTSQTRNHSINRDRIIIIAFTFLMLILLVFAINRSFLEIKNPRNYTNVEPYQFDRAQFEEEERQKTYSLYLKQKEKDSSSSSENLESTPQNTNAIYEDENLSSSSVVEETVSDSDTNVDSYEENDTYYFNEITISSEDVDLIVKAVQHEVRNDPTSFAGYDFDIIQQCMALTILNRIGRPGFADSVEGVLTQPEQFMPLSNLEQFDANDSTTRRNVLAVLNGESKVSAPNLVFEMSFESWDQDTNIGVMEAQVGDVIPYYAAINSEGRYLLFAEQAY